MEGPAQRPGLIGPDENLVQKQRFSSTRFAQFPFGAARIPTNFVLSIRIRLCSNCTQNQEENIAVSNYLPA